jgi:hypothetical protein
MEKEVGTATEMALQAQAIADKQVFEGGTPSDAPNGRSSKAERSGGKFDKAVEAMRELSKSGQKLDEESGTSEEKEEPVAKNDGTSEEKKEWEERYNNLLSRADRVANRYITLAKEAVGKDPNLIHQIAEEDEVIADKIIADELSDKGITSYKEFVKALENKDKPEPQIKIEKELEEIKARLDQKERLEMEGVVSKFLESHPEIDQEMADKIADLVDNYKMDLEDAYEFVSFKQNKGKAEAVSEEEAYKRLAQKEDASALSFGPSVRMAKAEAKMLSAKEREFLEAIGAKKTLAKYVK